MINQDYLKYLAKFPSIEEFILKYTIATGNDISANIADYEADYCNNIKNNSLYAKQFIKNGKVDFNDCINSKLPILIKTEITRDPFQFGDTYNIRFYNHDGEELSVELNLDLFADMQVMHGIDISAEIERVLQYELERSK